MHAPQGRERRLGPVCAKQRASRHLVGWNPGRTVANMRKPTWVDKHTQFSAQAAASTSAATAYPLRWRYPRCLDGHLLTKLMSHACAQTSKSGHGQCGCHSRCTREGTSFRLVKNPCLAVSERGTLSSIACSTWQQHGRRAADMKKGSWANMREEFSAQSGSNAE